MQFYGISFMHVQVFLIMNTFMFETCRRHYN